ncbi:MAG: Ig-like domain-containing protein [Ilumatobacteraceae bacterium]
MSLTGVLADGDVFVVVHGSASQPLQDVADLVSSAVINFNGDDAVVLRHDGTALDVVGQIGVDPGSSWGTSPTSTANQSPRRKATVETGDSDGTDAFDPALEWDGFPRTTSATSANTPCSVVVATPLPPSCRSSPPTTRSVSMSARPWWWTFSEPVNVTGASFGLECDAVPVVTTVTGGPTSFTLTPDAPLAENASCTLTVTAAEVTDVDAVDPPDAMSADVVTSFSVGSLDPCTDPYVSIPSIQGSGASAAITGTVTTQGVVVGEYEGSASLRGFYIQDPVGDGDPATSDALFVFDGSNADRVTPGDLVRLTGVASDFQGQTQISLDTATFITCGTGSVTPTDVTLPFAPAAEAESYEGMLVRFQQTLTVTELFQLGRFGQVLVSANGRLAQPTNVTTPGAAANALQAANDLNQIFIDDQLQTQNPDPIALGRGGAALSATNTLRGGDTVTDPIGVLTYTWAGNSASGNAYRLRPIGALGVRPSSSPSTNARSRRPMSVGP